jgi:hypothetical protein
MTKTQALEILRGMLLEMQEFSDNPERVYSDRGKALLMAINALEDGFMDWDSEAHIRRNDPDWNPGACGGSA